MHWATPQDRRTQGQKRRKALRRREHDHLNPKARTIAAQQLLEHAAIGRVPELLEQKWALMAASPFGYFRGAVPVMAADLEALPNTGILCQLCGDAHVRNLGAFAAPDGRLVFDINDFDETIRGPFEWDLKRMAASLVLAGRESGHKDTASRQAVECCIERYASEMRKFAEMSMLEVARYQVHRLQQVEPIEAALQKAERATPLHTLEQLTEPVTTEGKKKNAERRFKEIKPNLMRVRGVQAEEVLASLSAWQQMLAPAQRHLLSFYRPVDVAFKVVGTGSVGLRDYCIYFEGNGPQDPLFLQIKEEPLSGYAACLPDAHPPAHNGQRVAEGQRAMQVVSDPFLGWTHFGGRDYLVRQLNDHKGSIELADLAGDGLTAYAEICGELLARGHARSGDPMILAGYLGAGDGFAEALATFGITYADQTEKDWKTLCAALRQKGKSGEIKS